jgi:hydrogenase nickel incorporation protein HypA/HybF
VHELSLLKPVVTAVEQACGAEPVQAVRLRVGSLTGAVPEALEGSWPIAVAGTLLEGATLELEWVNAAVWCTLCADCVEIDEYFALACPACGTPTGSIVAGREFEVVWAETKD